MTNKKLVIFFSGEENLGKPETVLGNVANIMFTFINQQKKPDKRFREVYEVRKEKQRDKKADSIL